MRAPATILFALQFLFVGLTAAGGPSRLTPYERTDRIIVVWQDATNSDATTSSTASRAIAAGDSYSSAEHATALAKIVDARAARITKLKSAIEPHGVAMARHRAMHRGADVMQLSKSMSMQEIGGLKATLMADSAIADVLPDRKYFPALVPNDPCYAAPAPTVACPSAQWYLTQAQGINAPAAWDITTGNTTQVIAIIDTGILAHTEFSGRILPGYDFVSNTDKPRSNDGDGRDASATDPGDVLTTLEAATGPLAGCPVSTTSSWHGTTMAGVIAANANNAAGMAGINWSAKILPVRAVGKCGGYESDIINGLLWAAGISQPSLAGVPNNTTPAKVINMSITAAGICSGPLQTAINQVISEGVTIVAAAGNFFSRQASQFSPGSCDGVITVGAVKRDGGLPDYANIGSAITLSAPGGVAAPATDSIVTTSDSGITTAANDNVLRVTQGTSIATAQVTGIVSLMQSLKPALPPTWVKRLLRLSARPFPTNALNPCNRTNCGHGIADATAAVVAARDFKLQVGLSNFGVAGVRLDGTIAGVTPDISNVAQIAGDNARVFALKFDGTVWAHGDNDHGELGNGEYSDSTPGTFVATVNLAKIISIATSQGLSAALKGDGTVWAWGSTSACTFCGATASFGTRPAEISGLGDIVAIAGGGLALSRDGTVLRFSPGVLPTPVAGLVNAKKIGYNAVILSGGGVSILSPTQSVVGIANIIEVAGLPGGQKWIAVDTAGNVWRWQRDNANVVSVPVLVAGINNAVAVEISSARADGATVYIALRKDGTVWTWQGDSGVPAIKNGPDGLPLLLDWTADGLFRPQTNVAPSTLRGSNSATIAGIPAASAISVVNGEYRIGAGAYTTATGTISAGQIVTVRQTAQVECNQTGITRLTIAGIMHPFGVTTAFCERDQTPEPFAFAPQFRGPQGAQVISNIITISGVAGAVPISVLGGEYSKGCSGAFTQAAGTIVNGQTLCVRLSTASAPNIPKFLTLQVGAFSTKFHVTTGTSGDPDPFSFPLDVNVPVGSVRVSKPVQLAGFAGSLPLSVVGGEYSIGCTAVYSAAPQNITNGQSVCVRHTASAALYSENSTTLQAGTFTATFTSITGPPGFVVTPQITGHNDSIFRYSVALRSDGTVWAWGSPPPLGGAPFPGNQIPNRVKGLAGIKKIAAGIALRNDGTLWNFAPCCISQIAGLGGVTSLTPLFALMGDKTVKSIATTTAVAGLPPIAAIADYIALAIDGGVWTWEAASGPVLIAGLTTGVIAVASSGYGTIDFTRVALKSDGTVWKLTAGGPVQIAQINNAASIVIDYTHNMVLTSDGTLWSWGTSNYFGQIGGGTSADVPAPIVIMSGVLAIGTGDCLCTLAIKADGSVYAWGSNRYGWLGNGFTDLFGDLTYPYPQRVLDETGTGFFNSMAAGARANAFAFLPAFGVTRSSNAVSNAITVSGLATGAAAAISVTNGEISINGAPFTRGPASVVNGDKVVVRVITSGSFEALVSAIVTIGGTTGTSATFSAYTLRNRSNISLIPRVALGDSHTLLLSPSRVQYGFGANSNGQLGNGTLLGTSAPTANGNLTGVDAIVSGANHALALGEDGGVQTWGLLNGQRVTLPSRVPMISSAIAVAAGGGHSLALLADRTVRGWGQNIDGQLGIGGMANWIVEPVAVAGLSGIVAISAGARHSLALSTFGSVLAWGANDTGQLGDGSVTPKLVPGVVPGLTNVAAIAACGSHSLALKRDGTVWAWGANGFGQLGNGTSTTRLSPVRVPIPGGRIAMIACGDNHSLALRAGGRVYSWGANVNSQLGDGSNANRNAPFLLSNPINVVAVAGGARHTALFDASARLYVFGDNFFGQVGNKSGNYNPQSATLNALRGDSGISSVAGSAGTSVGTGSQSGSAIVRLAGLATGFDFGPLPTATMQSASVSGIFANQSIDTAINGVQISVSPAGEFDLTHQCAAMLAPGAECGFTVSFAPAAVGDRVGQVSIASDVIGSPQVLALVGAGVAPMLPAAKLAATFQSFVPTLLGTSSETASIALKNTGTANLIVSRIEGAVPNFTATHNCASVVPGATCAVDVTFIPQSEDEVVSILAIISNAATVNVTVAGIGVTPTPVVAPAAPILMLATAGNTQATIFFVPPADDGGAAINTYTVSCVGPSTIAATGSASPITVTGLTNGQVYACTMSATNSAGVGDLSAALNVTPSTTPALGIVNVFSRKNHGAGGIRDLPIDPVIAIAQSIGIEPRIAGAGHQIVFQFNVPISQAGTATVRDANSQMVGNATAGFFNNEVRVMLTGLPETARVTVSLAGVNNSTVAQAAIGFLVGDVNGSRSINAADIAAVKARVGQSANADNFRFDINLNGIISGADVSTVKARAGRVLP